MVSKSKIHNERNVGVSVVSSDSVKQVQLAKGFWSKRLITGPTSGSQLFMLSRVSMDPNSTSTGSYPDKDEALFILKGSVRISWNGHRKNLSPGDSVFIPMGTTTIMENGSKKSKAELLAVIAPSKTLEELQVVVH